MIRRSSSAEGDAPPGAGLAARAAPAIVRAAEVVKNRRRETERVDGKVFMRRNAGVSCQKFVPKAPFILRGV
jgi:hypothetical protein